MHTRRKVNVLGVLAILAALSVVGAAAAIWVILGQSTNPLWSRRPTVVVPELRGLTRAEAESLPELAGLDVQWEETYDPAAAPGLVCAQTPAAGRTLRQGQALTVRVSLGANLLTLKDAITENTIIVADIPVYLVGVAVAAVVGYLCIRLLKMIADKGRFGWFAYYCWGAGVIVLALALVLG